jgi:hypothetical protein
MREEKPFQFQDLSNVLRDAQHRRSAELLHSLREYLEQHQQRRLQKEKTGLTGDVRALRPQAT